MSDFNVQLEYKHGWWDFLRNKPWYYLYIFYYVLLTLGPIILWIPGFSYYMWVTKYPGQPYNFFFWICLLFLFCVVRYAFLQCLMAYKSKDFFELKGLKKPLWISYTYTIPIKNKINEAYLHNSLKVFFLNMPYMENEKDLSKEVSYARKFFIKNRTFKTYFLRKLQTAKYFPFFSEFHERYIYDQYSYKTKTTIKVIKNKKTESFSLEINTKKNFTERCFDNGNCYQEFVASINFIKSTFI